MADRVELMKTKKEDLKEAYGSMSREAREEHFGTDPDFKFHHMRTKVPGGTENLTEEDKNDIEHDIALAHTLQKQYLTQQELARVERHGEETVVDFDPEDDFGMHDSIRETTNRLYGQDTVADIWDHQAETVGSKDPIPLTAPGTSHLTVVDAKKPIVEYKTEPGTTGGFSEPMPLNEEGPAEETKEPEEGPAEETKEQEEGPAEETKEPEEGPAEETKEQEEVVTPDEREIVPMPEPEDGWSNDTQHTGIAHVVSSYHPERPPVEDAWYGQSVQEEPEEIHEPEFKALPDQFYAPSVITQLQIQNRLAWGWNLTQYPRRMKRKLRRRKVKRNV